MANNEAVYAVVYEALSSGETSMDEVLEDVHAALENEVMAREDDGQNCTPRTALGLEVMHAADEAKAIHRTLRNALGN